MAKRNSKSGTRKNRLKSVYEERIYKEKKMLFLRLKNDDDESSFEPYMDSSHDLVDWSHQFHEGVYCMSTR